MSHLTLTVTISADGDDIATQLAQWNSPHGVMTGFLRSRVVPHISDGANHGDLRDSNGNRIGVWDFSQIIDQPLPPATVTVPDYLGLAEATSSIQTNAILHGLLKIATIKIEPDAD